MLLRVAFHELSRRRGQLRSISGPEFDDLAEQAADDPLMSCSIALRTMAGSSLCSSSRRLAGTLLGLHAAARLASLPAELIHPAWITVGAAQSIVSGQGGASHASAVVG